MDRRMTGADGLNRHTLYRIPACAVSYSPELANVRVWFAGQYRTLPANGGTMALFHFANDGHTWHGEPSVWLRPFAVVTV
jgi:hypothetical protein